MIEKRKHRRYQVSNEALAILKPDPIKLGHIVNISEGGLAFQYLGDEKVSPYYQKLDIFASKSGKQFNAYPFRKIRDFRVSSAFEKTTPLRQLCVQFLDLSPGQISQLKDFINDYAS